MTTIEAINTGRITIPASLENAIRSVRDARRLLVKQYLPDADPDGPDYDLLVAATSVPEHLGELSLSLHHAYEALLNHAEDISEGWRRD